MKMCVLILLTALLTTLTGGCAFVNVEMLRSASPLQERTVEGDGKAKILVLEITGVISEKDQSGGQLFEPKPSLVSHIKESLQKAEKDKDVKGVILRINSPGGTVTASDIIYHELNNFRARTKMPVHACIIGLGASGGYYVATAADEITIHPTAVTGSIGVMVMKFNVEGLLSKVGVGEETIKSADKKDFFSPFRPTTAEELQIMQTIIDKMYGRFMDVIEARKGNQLDRQQIRVLADGRVYTADQALEGKLVDRIGYLDEVIESMKASLGVKEAKVISYYRRGGYKETIYSGGGIPQFNLININAGLDLLTSTDFLYLWKP
ncbi:signal peptide peptidase SppA [Geobacter sp. DSM 9736]|uniref:signal peptide peptidase SppA n=1 Tax=Geobacter sp. DSM 9736 TaxID=1277350 RepID=UPI000B50C0DF|nr:signal peptide peptidase SppA [Geobacter sp. DSM 9736]SNB48058.1 signal peptide peptidase A. Serine peptidase. MEROPS family S49 [Geobacter sp. DSM 9736]